MDCDEENPGDVKISPQTTQFMGFFSLPSLGRKLHLELHWLLNLVQVPYFQDVKNGAGEGNRTLVTIPR